MNRQANPRSLLALPLALALAASAFHGCTDASVEPIPPPDRYQDNKLELSGGLCTREPESLVFPLRVLFVVDASESMQVSDPPDPVTGMTAREVAVRDTWTDLLSQGAEDVRIGIIRFSAQAQSRTPIDENGDSVPDTYFTSDEDRLEAGTVALSETDRTTNYVNALGEAYFELRTEFLRADLESLPLSKYVVIFLSDGLPDLDDEEAELNSDENILDGVHALQELAELYNVGTFEFHTAFIASGQAAVDQPAQDLLQKMAEEGDGTYRSFPSGEELNFLFVDLSIIRRVFTLRNLIAVNMNAVVDYEQTRSFEFAIPPTAALDVDFDGFATCGEPLVDSDGDGLADIVEGIFLSDPLNPDSDDDGLSDRAEWDINRLVADIADAFDPNDPSDSGCFVADPCLDEDMDGFCDCRFDVDADGICNCAEDPGDDDICADSGGHDCVDADVDGFCDCPDADDDGRCDYGDGDGDGLNDCEELFSGTAQNGVDTDADGIPDPIELRFRTAATEPDDRDDLDFDLTVNGVEVQAATDPRCEDAGFRSRLAYRYDVQTVGVNGSSTCYEFSIGNISLAPTQPNPKADHPGNGWNRILVYAGEVAFDDPETYARYRVACVMANYKWYGDFKNPPSGRMELTEADFVDIGEFDPEVHCRRP